MNLFISIEFIFLREMLNNLEDKLNEYFYWLCLLKVSSDSRAINRIKINKMVINVLLKLN